MAHKSWATHSSSTHQWNLPVLLSLFHPAIIQGIVPTFAKTLTTQGCKINCQITTLPPQSTTPTHTTYHLPFSLTLELHPWYIGIVTTSEHPSICSIGNPPDKKHSTRGLWYSSACSFTWINLNNNLPTEPHNHNIGLSRISSMHESTEGPKRAATNCSTNKTSIQTTKNW